MQGKIIAKVETPDWTNFVEVGDTDGDGDDEIIIANLRDSQSPDRYAISVTDIFRHCFCY